MAPTAKSGSTFLESKNLSDLGLKVLVQGDSSDPLGDLLCDICLVTHRVLK